MIKKIAAGVGVVALVVAGFAAVSRCLQENC